MILFSDCVLSIVKIASMGLLNDILGFYSTTPAYFYVVHRNLYLIKILSKDLAGI